MNDRNRLLPSEQRRLLADQMRILRGHSLMARSNTAEALARSRELLRVPIYRRPKLDSGV